MRLLLLAIVCIAIAGAVFWLRGSDPGLTPGPLPLDGGNVSVTGADTPLHSPTQDAPTQPLGESGERAEVAPQEAEVDPTTDRRNVVRLGDLTLDLSVRDDLGRAVEVVLLHAVHTPALLEDGTQPRTQQLTRSMGSASGTFHVGGFCPGEWVVVLSAPAFEWEKGMGREIVRVTLPQTGAPLNVILPRPASVSGTVLDEGGAPLEGALVKASVLGHRLSTRITGSLGEFAFETLPAGPLRLEAEYGASEAATELELRPGEEHRGVSIAFPVAGSIVGLVLGPDDAPLAGMDVVLLAGDKRLGSLRSDEQGRFLFDPVQPGSYFLLAAHSDLAKDSNPSFFENLVSTSIEVRAGAPTETILKIGRVVSQVRVHGTVTRKGEPVEQGTLFVIREGSSLIDSTRAAAMGSGGQYSIELAGPGPVMFFDAQHLEQPVSVVDVPPVATFRHDIQMPAGDLRALVAGGEGTVWVRLHSMDGFSVTGGTGSDEQETRTGAGGMRWARFKGLAPGTYSVSGRSEGGQVGRSLSITLGASEKRDLQLTLDAGGRAVGRVLDGEQAPVAGARVTVLCGPDGILTGTAESDALGKFEIGALPPGPAVIIASRGGDCAQATGEIRAATELSRDLVLNPGAQLTVQVHDGTGRHSSASIRVFDGAGREVSFASDRMGVSSRGTSVLNSDVNLSSRRLGPLPPGTYDVRVRAWDGRTVEKRVQLKAGEEARLELSFS